MRIGIILTGDYNWAGGVYYSLNIIKLLHQISKTTKLEIAVIVNSSTPQEVMDALPQTNIKISYLDKRSLFYRLYHKIKKDRFAADINALKLDMLYPLIAYDPVHYKINCKLIYWMYDFQHKFLPELFSEEELKKRDLNFANMAQHTKNIVFSSVDSKSHFEQFYPKSKANKFVYHFVSLLDDLKENMTEQINISGDYFIVCNQFWPHKNHMVVLKALNQLIKEKKGIKLVFTGKYKDERNKKYVDELLRFISEHNLTDYVNLTGFISREAQIDLMKKAKAIIQPSFFEGWSTVVEDAKALDKFLMASNINVNKEQINTNVLFFDPNDHLKLAEYLGKFNEKMITKSEISYQENIEASKKDLIKLFNITSRS